MAGGHNGGCSSQYVSLRPQPSAPRMALVALSIE
jgi:hypothetical protein